MKQLLALLLFLAFACTGYAQYPPPYTTDMGKKVYKALSSDLRHDGESDRDMERKPVATLEFFGLRDDMRVLELVPGSGWYTAILAKVLAENGELYVAIGERFLGDRLLQLEGKLEVVGQGIVFERDESQPGFVGNLQNVELGVDKLDMVLTFRNVHNISKPSRAELNKAVFDALEPGGIYGIIDHTRRHMAPVTGETWRRADPVEIIEEVLDAGFEFVDYSDLHYRADDELRYDTLRPSIDRFSDRFTLKFRKPG
jgi:predicted methyltransferase